MEMLPKACSHSVGVQLWLGRATLQEQRAHPLALKVVLDLI